MRSIWSGAISFGLVNIPVKIYSATQESSLNLDMLDSKDLSNIRFKRVNENTGREVPYEEIVKGYLYNGEYVVIEPEDFQAADAVKTKLIEIINFVDETEIDSVYFEKPYYVAPDKSGMKAYSILRDALAEAGKAGLASFVLRNKEHLAVIKPQENVIVLDQLRYEEEIRDFSELDLPAVTKIKPKELEVALKLIDQLTEKFDISQFKDTYTEKLLKIIEDKAKGVKPKVRKMKLVHTKSDDLMSTLKASLAKRKKAS